MLRLALALEEEETDCSGDNEDDHDDDGEIAGGWFVGPICPVGEAYEKPTF